MAKKKITDLKFDDKNFNIGSQQGNALLEKSIQKFGFREAATVDKNGVLIGGNKRTAKAGELGFEDVEIIKADPKKVYALQYDDIDIDTPEGRSLALALNATAKSNIVLDAELVEAELGEAVCEEWGVEKQIQMPGEDELAEDRKNNLPVMKITFETPDQLQKAEVDITELIDRKYKGAFYSVSAGEL